MGLKLGGNVVAEEEMSPSHYRTHKAFLLCNYVVLGLASSCIFLTLSLRLIPSLSGFSLIVLHVLTIVGAVSGCAAANSSRRSGRWYATHMVTSVLTAIFQGAVAVLIFTRTSDFLVDGLKSYVKEDDGSVILRMAGGLCVALFCLQWVIMGLAFALRYYEYIDGGATATLGGGGGGVGMVRRSNKVEDMKDWPWPFQV